MRKKFSVVKKFGKAKNYGLLSRKKHKLSTVNYLLTKKEFEKRQTPSGIPPPTRLAEGFFISLTLTTMAAKKKAKKAAPKKKVAKKAKKAAPKKKAAKKKKK
ncbi:MAG: hypothetical protein PHO48_01170 [Candidatus Gracilibacteria bacterium]|nr:hypothetical protein [Candidatus Gracilibacteria bacterium]MDD5178812.1 hypothetical protein [Candidatus Gracilibacteria bacterium]